MSAIVKRSAERSAAIAEWQSRSRGLAPAVELRPLRLDVGPCVVTIVPRQVGDFVAAETFVETPFGPFQVAIMTPTASFNAVVDMCEEHGVIPKLSQLVEHATSYQPMLIEE